MNQHDLINRMVNGDRRKFWCPVCEQNRENAAAFCPWFGPPPIRKFVCSYAVCGPCTETFWVMPERLRYRVCDQIEQRLLNRYPDLYKRLPDGYSPGPAAET